MTEKQVIAVAKAGFKTILEYLSLDDLICMTLGSGIYRLHEKDMDFIYTIPRKSVLVIEFYPETRHVLFDAGGKAFNQLAAIEKMSELGLIDLKKTNHE